MKESSGHGEANKPNSLSFSIPLVPPSMNSLYNVLYGLRRIELKPEARIWKSQAKQFIPSWTYQDDTVFVIDMEVGKDWKYKNGKWKREDVQNMGKLVVDTVCEKLGFDDSRVWTFTCRKRQDEEGSGIKVRVEEFKGELGVVERSER